MDQTRPVQLLQNAQADEKVEETKFVIGKTRNKDWLNRGLKIR